VNLNFFEQATGASSKKMNQLWQQYGDIGDVAFECRSKQLTLVKRKPLAVADVFNTLKQITLDDGKGSLTRKKQMIVGLIARASAIEAKYIARTVVCNLRFVFAVFVGIE
jgi:DNA ligase-1